MTAHQFEHNGIKIDLLPSGHFSATVGGKTRTAPSLAALKKKLDGDKVFQEFPALVICWSKIREVRVVGVINRRLSDPVWNLNTGEARHEVYADTPENRAALTAYLEQTEAHNREVARRGADLRAALDAIPTVRPEGAER